MSDEDVHVDNEPPWLQSLVDQRLAQIKEATGGATFKGFNIIMVFLTEPPENASNLQMAAWDKTCDKCSRYAGDDIVGAHVQRVWDTVNVVIAFGLCPDCFRLLS